MSGLIHAPVPFRRTFFFFAHRNFGFSSLAYSLSLRPFREKFSEVAASDDKAKYPSTGQNVSEDPVTPDRNYEACPNYGL